MNKVKQFLGLLISMITVVFFFLFKRESKKREAVEKELVISKQANSAAQANKKALEIKQNVKSNNMRDSRDIDERMRAKGYLRD